MSDDDVEEVMATCWKCPVRPECLSELVETSGSGVWCCSEFIPEVALTDTPRKARAVLEAAEEIRLNLAKSLPEELDRRGDF